MTKINITVLVLLMALCSCTGTKSRVILKHPETQEFKECQMGIWSVTTREQDECVKKYEAQGYEVWGKR